MDLSSLGSGSLSLERIVEPWVQFGIQEEFQEQWVYNTWAEPTIHRPVRNREHARLLLASIDEKMEWVTFGFQNRPGFSQAAIRKSGLLVVEVNTVPINYADRVIRTGGFGDIGNPASANFGNMEALTSQEEHTAAEAFAICCSWMDHQVLPEGYSKAPTEE